MPLPISWYTLETDGSPLLPSCKLFNPHFQLFLTFSFFPFRFNKFKNILRDRLFFSFLFSFFLCVIQIFNPRLRILLSSPAKIENEFFETVRQSMEVDGIFYFISMGGKRIEGRNWGSGKGGGTLVASNNFEKEDLILSLLDPSRQIPPPSPEG